MNNNSKLYTISLCVISLFVSGCRDLSTTSATNTPNQEAFTLTSTSNEVYELNTSTPQLIETRIITPSPSPAQIPIPSNTPDWSSYLSESCAEFKDTLEYNLEGVIILENSDSHIQLFDLNDKKMIDIGRVRDIAGGIGISQNRQSFAYIDIDENRLIVANSDGSIDKSIEVSENWQNVIQWIDYDSLLLEKMPLHPDESINPPAFSVHYDFLNNEVLSEYDQRFPGQIYLGNGKPDWGPFYFTQAVFNSDFDRVLYPTLDDNGSFSLVLWDLKKNNEIAKFYGNDPDTGGMPSWNRRGDSFVAGIYLRFEDDNGDIIWNYQDGTKYEAGYDLFLINKNGELNRLTFLSTTYRAREEGYVLSPDEKNLAFWLTLFFNSPDWSDERQLAILDLETKEIMQLCVQGNDYHYPPVWSPDGRYLAITIGDWKNDILEVFVVDLTNNTYSKIADDSIGIGWLNSPD